MSYRLEADEQERKLFVGKLNKENTDEEALKNYFEAYGNIVDCTIMRDQDRVSRGFGFVLFEDASSVDRVMIAKRGGEEFLLNDYNIETKRALPRVAGGNAGSSHTNGLNRKIFVGGLPFSVTEEDLRSYFEAYGHVNDVELLRDRETSKLRGFAFVTFNEEDSADKCLQRRQHEICKKICEVKRVQTRANFGEKDGNRSQPRFNCEDRQPQNIQLPSGGGGMSMVEVNQLIRQAFLLGQQSVQGTQLPTVSSLLNGSAAPPPATNNNILLQALMNQPTASAPVLAPAPTPVAPAPANNNSDLVQLAQLLQRRGIDANSLAGLLKNDAPAPPTPLLKTNGLSTSYYGPTKDNRKHGYRPY